MRISHLTEKHVRFGNVRFANFFMSFLRKIRIFPHGFYGVSLLNANIRKTHFSIFLSQSARHKNHEVQEYQ